MYPPERPELTPSSREQFRFSLDTGNDYSSSHTSAPPSERRAHPFSPPITRVSGGNHNIDAQLDDPALLTQLTTGTGVSIHGSSQAIPDDSSLVQGGCLSSFGLSDPLSNHQDVEYTQLQPFTSLDLPWHLFLSQHQSQQAHSDQSPQVQRNPSTSPSSLPSGGPSLTIQNVNHSESLDQSSIHATAFASGSTFEPDSTQTELERPPVAEEKRRRNTEASARFRIKKKQRTINLERTINDLKGRAEDLEREAADLRRENGWLKEIVVLKGSRFAVENLASNIIADSVQRAAERSRRQSDPLDGDLTDSA